MSDRTPMETARAKAEATATDGQELNRQWWEHMPMTYKARAAEGREHVTESEFMRLEADFLDANPWMAQAVDFNAYRGKKVLEVGCGGGAASPVR